MHPKEAYHQHTGTGRLACLSLKDAEIIVGIDFTHNAKLNRLLSDPDFFPMVLYPGEDSLTAEAWDLVFVNIVADVIIALAPSLSRLLGSGNAAVCSGILDTRLRDVKAALEKAGLRIVAEKAKEDWRCVTVRRRTL